LWDLNPTNFLFLGQRLRCSSFKLQRCHRSVARDRIWPEMFLSWATQPSTNSPTVDDNRDSRSSRMLPIDSNDFSNQSFRRYLTSFQASSGWPATLVSHGPRFSSPLQRGPFDRVPSTTFFSAITSYSPLFANHRSEERSSIRTSGSSKQWLSSTHLPPSIAPQLRASVVDTRQIKRVRFLVPPITSNI
jgi:hypothetical protein